MDGSGSGRGADLRGELKYGHTPSQVADVIRNGIPGIMPGSKLGARQVRHLAAFVLTLNRRARAKTAAPAKERP